jgi:TusA-related sulfurtransferase
MLKAVEAMKKLKGRELVIVVTDHAPCLETIPPQAGRYGYTSEIEQTGQPEWTITLTPKGATP